MRLSKKLLLTGCVLAIGLALIKWIIPQYTEIEMAFSESPPDGNYVITDFSDVTERIKIKHGKIYCLK
jgi:hypothetical protein